RPPTSTLFPYTTLFRSLVEARGHDRPAIRQVGHAAHQALVYHWLAQRLAGLRVPQACGVVDASRQHRAAVRGEGDDADSLGMTQDRKSTRLNSSHDQIS